MIKGLLLFGPGLTGEPFPPDRISLCKRVGDPPRKDETALREGQLWMPYCEVKE